MVFFESWFFDGFLMIEESSLDVSASCGTDVYIMAVCYLADIVPAAFRLFICIGE